MCYILTAIKLKENYEAKNAILNVLKEEQTDNEDGSGSLCYENDKPKIQREMFLGWDDMEKILDDSTIVNFHFRKGTSGVKTIKNIHFWKVGNWAFCHNGTITGLDKKGKCDSLVFFENLIKKGYLTNDNKLKGTKIKEYTNNQTNFWGRFLIINLKTKNMYFFGDFELYLVNKSYIVLTSSGTTFENKTKIMGLEFDIDDSIETIDSKIDGVWMFDFNKKTFIQIFEKFKEWRSYTYETEADYEQNNNKLIETKNKPRTQESYKKEFWGRLEGEAEIYPHIEEQLLEEYDLNEYNAFGRTETEEIYWQLWITPQLKAGNFLDFELRSKQEQEHLKKALLQ